VAANPDDVEALLVAGIVAVKRNDPATAVPSLKRNLGARSDVVRCPFWLSMIMRRHGRHADAVEMRSARLAKNGGSEQALNQLGMCHMDLNNGLAAVACFRGAIERAPDVAHFLTILGARFSR